MSLVRAHLLRSGLALSVAAASHACAQASDSSEDTTVESKLLCAPAEHDCAALKATFAGSPVSVTCAEGDTSALLSASGLPPYRSAQTDLAVAQNWELVFPLEARCGTSPQAFRDADVAIGLLWNGVAIYPARSVAGEAFGSQESGRRDPCGGVTGNGCAYAYRGASLCAFGDAVTLASRREGDGHGGLVGWLVDGFPLHSEELAPGEPALDGCNGHETPARGYHYHAAAGDLTAPPCLVGRDRGDLRFTALLPASCTPSTSEGGGTGTGGPGGGGTGGPGDGDGPPSCQSTDDCTSQKCPPGSQGCVCVTTPMGSKICAPTCTVEGDCPTGSGLPSFQCVEGHCAPR